MKFAVTELRQRGVRLSREEIATAPAACGDLLIRDVPFGTVEKRPVKEAKVMYTRRTFPHGLLTPLFEPVLVRMGPAWFVLSGWQIDATDGAAVQYRQEWLVRPSTDELEAAQEMRLSEYANRVRVTGLPGQ